MSDRPTLSSLLPVSTNYNTADQICAIWPWNQKQNILVISSIPIWLSYHYFVWRKLGTYDVSPGQRHKHEKHNWKRLSSNACTFAQGLRRGNTLVVKFHGQISNSRSNNGFIGFSWYFVCGFTWTLNFGIISFICQKLCGKSKFDKKSWFFWNRSSSLLDQLSFI